ncbi:MFS transporter, partial [Staphylococcus devriesei]|uniref:MFS transporter n=1 Tax=Staphylococcus devriesei TaxID=586733 RepID=UPI000E67F290
SKTNSNSFLKDIKVGFSYLIKNKILLNFMLVGLIINFLVNSVVVGVPIIAIQSMKLSSQQFGFTEAGMTIGMFIVSLGLSIRPLKHRLKGPFEISVILQVIALWRLSLSIFLSLTVNMSFILITLVYFIAGLSLPLANIPYSIYLQNTVEEQYKGRVFSLNQSIAQSLMPVSFLIFGFILKYSQSLTYLIVSILMLVVLVYFDKTVRKEDIKF